MLVAACDSTPSEPSEEATPDTAATSAAPSPTASAADVVVVGALAVEPAHVMARQDGGCMAFKPDYLGFNEEAQVTVTDSSGDIVGVGELDAAEWFSEDACARWFEVVVPPGGGFYTASVGDWTSDAYAESDLAESTVSIVLH